MWSDNDIDDAFRRLDPAGPEPTPFPLDAWLKLEAKLDEAVIARAVRRRLWQVFAAEVAAVVLVALGWQFWPAGTPARQAAPTLVAIPAAGGRVAQATASTTSASASSTAVNAAELAPRTPATAKVPAWHHLMAKTQQETVATTAAGALTAPRRAAAPGTSAASASASVATGAAHVEAGAAVARPSATHAPVAAARQLSRPPGQFSRNDLLAKGLATRPGEAGRRVQIKRAATPLPGGTLRQPTLMKPASVASSVAFSAVPPAASASSAVAARQPSFGRRVADRPTRQTAAAGVAAPHAPGTRQLATVSGVVGGPPASATAATATSAASASAGVWAGSLEELRPLTAAVATLGATDLPTALAPVAVAPTAALPSPLRQPRLYVGLVAAPDVSTVRFADVEAPALNFGLTLDYRLGNRLRLSTGLLRSNKKYVARREDYDWGAYGARVYSRNFSDVEGTCTVLDVPLNLRYDLLVQPGYRLVSTVGLSSFFMQHEKYEYGWTDATGAHTWTTTAVNENQHFLSILNLALGAEYGLGTRWSLLAEPYVKLPLAGVGLGKVKLLSAGVYVGVKYGF